MNLKRENTRRNIAFICAAVMTLALVGLLLFQFLTYDRKRTLHTALERTEGVPLIFSADSGFYENSFLLQIDADENIPQDDSIEIHYTTNGDEPTENSPLYKEGIDLEEVIRQLETSSADETTAPAASAAPAAPAAAEESDKSAASDSSDTSSAADNASTEEDPYSLESQRRLWEENKKAMVSDNGVYVEKTEDGIHVIPVRACLIQGEDKSSVVTRTYVIGPGVFERYYTYVACISTDSYNLFDYDNGIMVPGSHYQKDIDEGKREDRSGNYYQEGEEWIKNGHVTLFSPEGEVLLEEDTGITVGGYSSRAIPTKSLRAEASMARGTSDDWFHLDIFESGFYSPDGSRRKAKTDTKTETKTKTETETDTSTAAVTVSAYSWEEPVDFQKIRFRTHGVPSMHIRSVRNEYAKKLTDVCGFPGLPESRLGVTYLNGEFYTVCDIMPTVTKEYMCTVFGLNTPDAIERYDSSDYDIYTRTKILRLLNADLTQPENQKALEEAVDMDNYLFYFAIEVLLNNADWPFNNVTMWRYIGEYKPDNPYTDGRYRFMLDDMDQILTNDLHGIPEQWSTELVDYLMRDKGNTFYHVMQCKKYRDTFLIYVDDLLKTVFEPEYACPILDALYGDMKREYILDYGEAFWEEMEDTAEITKNNVREKEELYRADITKYMGLTDRYSVQIETGEGVSVSWNNMTVPPGGTWSNEYYRGTAFTVTARPGEGYRFAGWEINGIDGETGETLNETLTISDALSLTEMDNAHTATTAEAAATANIADAADNTNAEDTAATADAADASNDANAADAADEAKAEKSIKERKPQLTIRAVAEPLRAPGKN